MKRRRMSRKGSRRSFRKGNKTRGKNLSAKPMRGGWRI